MNKSVIVIGAGGHGRVVADIVLSSGENLLGFLDDGDFPSGTAVGIPVLGRTSDFKKYPEAEFIIAVGSSRIRERISAELSGVNFYTAVHPRAVVSRMNTAIGEGSAVMANAVINPCAHIGRHSIINTGAAVEHDCVVGDYCHISVGSKLGGTVSVGDHTWIGIGATVINNITICGNCIIGAGAVVTDDIKESGTYVGVPAHRIK